MPKVKFVGHNLFAVMYLFVYILQLLGIPDTPQARMWMYRGTGYLLPGSISALEWVNWFWTLCRVYEESFQIAKNGGSYFLDSWNRLDITTYFLILSTAVLRIIMWVDCDEPGLPESFSAYGVKGNYPRTFTTAYYCPTGDGRFGLGAPVSEEWNGYNGMQSRRDQMLIYCSIAYALGAICNFLRLINSCSYWESVGVLKIILSRMIKNDISSWFVITIWVTLGFSVAFAVLEPANANNENQLDRPFFIPWQGLLGEFDFGARYDVLEAGTTIAVIVPILLWVYTFVATVILVNLLIAQMSSTYEEVKEDSCNIWRADRVHSVVSEYKDNREVLPPPLNILTLPYHVRNGTLRAWARCCTDQPAPLNTDGFVIRGSAAKTASLRKQEKRNQRAFVKQRESENMSKTERRVEDVQRRMEKMETENRNMLEQLNGRFDNMMKGPDRGGGGGGSRGGGGGRPGGGAATKVETQIQQLSTMLTRLEDRFKRPNLAPINAEASPVTKRGSIGRHLPVSADEGSLPAPVTPPNGGAAPRRPAPTLPPKLPPSWQSATHTDGRTYYYNRSTGESQWKPPAVESGAGAAQLGQSWGTVAGAYPAGDGAVAQTL